MTATPPRIDPRLVRETEREEPSRILQMRKLANGLPPEDPLRHLLEREIERLLGRRPRAFPGLLVLRKGESEISRIALKPGDGTSEERSP